MYYNRRMQRVFSVQFSGDSRWVLSGSDEGSIRLWKANTSEDIGTALPREQRAKEYRDQLKARFAHMPEIRRISRHRNVPKSIDKATIAKRGTNPHHVCYHCSLTSAAVIKEAADKRLSNKRAHSKPGSVPFVAERKKKVLRTEA